MANYDPKEIVYYPATGAEGSLLRYDMSLSKSEIKEIAREAAREVMHEMELTHDDVKDMKSLIHGVRIAGNEMLRTFVRIAIIGLCLLGGIKYIG